MSDERLKIAVFIDFDNIEIGVKTTLGGQFDVGVVLEAVKERGEVVSKVAYGDWTRATDYGRSMSQHAIHMVQRNLTPGGDKNGADINLALDALEMAFTHNHINAFVIVGGDSDFITLVEKLKQYDRKVFVVGGRSFTSHVMQKNCTEFLAYEDILGLTSRGRQAGGRPRVQADIKVAMPLVRRALKLLADREMTPQLGLLKSTLLQLDSSFSEKAYGSGSFRDFVEKLAKAGHVLLKGTERSYTVELSDAGDAAAGEARGGGNGSPSENGTSSQGEAAAETPAPGLTGGEAQPAEGAVRLGPADGYRIMVQAFAKSGVAPRFPMYVRQVKQFIRGFDESFDERRYGFAGILDALRFGQREGLFRLDRDRQGGVRVHPGAQFPKLTASAEGVAEGAAAGGEIAQASPAPIDVAAAAIPEAPLAATTPPSGPVTSPSEAEAAAARPESAEVPIPTDGEPAAAEEAEAPAKAEAAPRATARKRTTVARAGATPRAKKAASPPPAAKKPAAKAPAAKKTPARPRAKKA